MQRLQPQRALTAEEATLNDIAALKERLHYEPETGAFTWRVKAGRQAAGAPAGSVWSTGHVGVRVNGKTYLSHRLAWAFVHGGWPEGDIDHINRCPADNRICNLRLATRAQNVANTGARSTNKSGVKGVYWSKRKSRWIARVQSGGKHGWVGSFETLEAASSAVKDAYAREFGVFAS